MQWLRTALTAAVPAGIGLAAFLSAQAVTSLVGARLEGPMAMSPVAEARASTPISGERRADGLLGNNPFDHLTPSLHPPAEEPVATPAGDPTFAPPCPGVRPVVLVRGERPDGSMAALDVDGKRLVRRTGDLAGAMRVAFVAEDRVLLERDGAYCQAQMFPSAAPPGANVGVAEPAPAKHAGVGVDAPSALEVTVARGVSKTGPNEYAIDRGAFDRLVDALAELRKPSAVPVREGDRIVGLRLTSVKPGTAAASLGLESGDVLRTVNGFETANTQSMFEFYAKIRAGEGRFTIHLTRGGKPTNLDYTVR